MHKLNVKTCDAAEMAGDINIYVRIVGRLLYKNLCDAITDIAEPGVLVVSFKNINQVQDSVLLISIIKVLDLCRRNKWKKTIICTEISEMHRQELQEALELWPDVSDIWGKIPDSQKRLLLLISISSLSAGEQWELLGELKEYEQKIWAVINTEKQSLVLDLANQLGLDKQILIDQLDIFKENQLIFFENGTQLIIHKLFDLIVDGSSK